MSYNDHDNFVDPYNSEVAKTIRDRSKPGIALLPTSTKGPGPSCPLCHVFYISRENGTMLFCPNCGSLTKAVDVKQDTKVAALYAPLSRSSNRLIRSQTQKQRRGKTSSLDDEDKMSKEELRKELGFEPSSSVSVIT